MNGIHSILFVCTGNSCRSVMAEALMRKELTSLGKNDIIVQSAGVYAVDGMSPTSETIKALKDEGIDISGFTSRSVTKEMVQNSDLILVMEDAHKRYLVNEFPDASSKVFLLKSYLSEGKGDSTEDLQVSDPIGKPLDCYKESLNTIKDNVKRIAGKLLSY